MGASTKNSSGSYPLTVPVPIAGKLLGIGFQRSYLSYRAGEIPVIKMGRRVLVPVGWIAEQLHVPIEEVGRRAVELMKAEAAS